MPKELYINAWKASKATLQINNAIDNRSKGINGIANYRLPDTELNRVPSALAYAMGFQRGSDTSWYQLFIPPMNNEVIKVRISDHKSTKTEWPSIEDCLPNRRYSVVIFNEKSMHIQKEAHIKYVDWVRYDVEGIPVYEIMIYCGILPLVWTYLYKIFTSLYNGEHPESNLIKDYFHLKSDDKNKPINDVVAQWNKTIDKNTNESKKYKNMKKNVQRIKESQLRAIVAESVKKMLTEATDDLPEAIEMQDKFAEAILFKLRELETFWWEKHKTPYPYSREVLKKALKGYDWEHKQGGEGLEYCGFER